MTILLLALQIAIPLGLDTLLPTPEHNRMDAAKAALGRKLFFDPKLSRDGSTSCATCHDPQRSFTDGHPLAVGIGGQKGTRRTPAILNRAYGKSFFWDGRTVTLEQQVLMPIENPIEMNLSLEDAVHRVGTSRSELAAALATYVRTILAGDSPYDRYVNGDRGAITAEQRAGLDLFRGKANCASCHIGPNLTDERFHNTGLPGADPGRFAVTGLDRDRGAFKTPTLREIARRAPYMHDGSLATLEDVIAHYDKGGEPHAALDAEMMKLNLTPAEKKALLAFLQALSGVVKDGWE